MPRQVFALSPGETKPVYVDFESPVLTQILCRQLRRAAADFPGQPARFTEMLPAAQDCWLADEHGQRYTSELRLVAVDLARSMADRQAESVLLTSAVSGFPFDGSSTSEGMPASSRTSCSALVNLACRPVRTSWTTPRI